MVHNSGEDSELTPAKIRAIRKSLGLTQVEASELFGGGPRAFTKYEAGSVKPAASVVTLLRLVEKKPVLLNDLQGGGPRPIPPNSNISPFEISGEHIQALDAHRFSELLRRLLSAEAQENALPKVRLHVASNINAPDGGEDGFIGWDGGPDQTEFLPCRQNLFQLKSGKIPPSRAGLEVLTSKGEVKAIKARVREVVAAGGCYIMLSNRPFTHQAIKKREQRITETLRDAELTVEERQIQFRDANQIATWVNDYFAIATWIREITQPGTVGPFTSWDDWAKRREHALSPWVDDERLQALRTDILQQATELRGAIHVCGLLGVGKSRLVLKALEPTEDSDTSISHLVMYADASESKSGPAEIKRTTRTIAGSRQRAIIVVDRCTAETRRTLVGIVKRRDSRLSLVTIDDEIIPKVTDQQMTTVYEALPVVTEQIVKNLAPKLPPEDSQRLESFSRGFPQIAVSVAEAWKNSIPLPHATEDDIVERFILGNDSSVSSTLLTSARLLAVFGKLRIGPYLDSQLEMVDCDSQIKAVDRDSQLETVARFRHDLEKEDLYADIRKLVRRGVAKKRGSIVMFPPNHIILRLAESQWQEWSPSRWDEILAGDTFPELMMAAARQLSKLNTTEISREVTQHLCRLNGPLVGPKRIYNPSQTEVLAALVQIDAIPVVHLLEQSFKLVGDLSKLEGDARRNIVWTLEQAAFCPDTFEDAAHLLLELATAENEPYTNNATEVFKALFPLLLSKTEADGSSRLAFLDEVSNTTDLKRRLIVEALMMGIKTEHFYRDVGAEIHGLRPALHSWRPRTREEAVAYVKACIKRLTGFAIQSDDVGRAARRGLEDSLRSLISSGLVEMELVEAIAGQMRSAHGNWTEAIRSLNRFLRLDGKEANIEVVGRVKALVDTLRPIDLKAQVLFLISQYIGDYMSSEDMDSSKVAESLDAEIRNLADELVNKPEILNELLPEASSGLRPRAIWLGECLARARSAEGPLVWLTPIKEAFLEAPEDVRNSDLLAGFLGALSQTHPSAVDDFKRSAAQSKDFAPELPKVCWHCGIISDDIDLVIRAIQAGLLRPHKLEQWTIGAKLRERPPSDVAPFFDAMLNHSSEAFLVAVDLICMYVWDDIDRLGDLWPQVIRVAKDAWKCEDSEIDVMTDQPFFVQLMTTILERGREDSQARTLALTLVGMSVESIGRESFQLVEELLLRLLSDFPEITWPLIGQAIISKKEQRWLFEFELRKSSSLGTEPKPAILSLPEEALLAWCRAHPDGAPAFAAATLPLLKADEGGKPLPSLHPAMVKLIDEFGDCNGVLQAIGRNMYNFTGTDSVTTRLQLYREPLTALQDHPKGVVRRWARAELRDLDVKIEEIKAMDDEEDAMREI